MRKILVGFVFVAASSLAPSAGHADVPCTPVEFVVTGTCYSWWPKIPDEPLCSDYVTAWIAMAKAAKEKRCSPGGAEWSTDVRTLGDYCLSAGTDANNARTADMKRVMSACDACSHTVDGVLQDVVDNVLYGCGFSNPDGRWATSRESQINRCVVAATLLTKVGLQGYENADAQMSEDVRICKMTHTNKNCVSCHDAPSSTTVQSMPKSGNALRDALKRLSSRTKPKDLAVEDPCKSGGRVSNSPCKQSPTRPKEEGGGNPMDRLGNQNSGNLGTVSGSAGGAQIGRPATPGPTTSPTTSAPPDSVVRTPARSNTETGVNGTFRSRPTFPTFNDSNTIR